ncbi:MAG: hypothetical protein QXO65_03730 [Candidatus Aenigmatarchaeota archaeon]
MNEQEENNNKEAFEDLITKLVLYFEEALDFYNNNNMKAFKSLKEKIYKTSKDILSFKYNTINIEQQEKQKIVEELFSYFFDNEERSLITKQLKINWFFKNTNFRNDDFIELLNKLKQNSY